MSSKYWKYKNTVENYKKKLRFHNLIKKKDTERNFTINQSHKKKDEKQLIRKLKTKMREWVPNQNTNKTKYKKQINKSKTMIWFDNLFIHWFSIYLIDLYVLFNTIFSLKRHDIYWQLYLLQILRALLILQVIPIELLFESIYVINQIRKH